MMLADMGCSVIKVERPGKGDDSRSWGPPFIEGESTYFMSVNRNKKSITINMKTEESKEIIEKLIKKSDVLVENFRPGIMERLGFDYEKVKEMNPRIIYCSISGFGQDGPYKNLPGFDQVLQGMGGLMSMTGEKGGPPIKVGVAVTDIAAGNYAAYGIMVALFNRERTGIGQMVDISMMDCQVSWLTYRAGAYFATGKPAAKFGTGHAIIVPYQAFKAKDVYINIAVGNDRLWERFCKLVGLEEIMNDPKYVTNAKRVINRDELEGIIGKLISTKNRDEWLELLRGEGIPCGPIYNMEEIFKDPQVLHRNMLKELPHSKAGKVKVTGIPVKLSETPGELILGPPLLGEQTVEILKDLGYSQSDIDVFKKKNAI
jgi:formyl-CoA transferase/CoA:oxalate CoA-transferase